MKKFFSSLLKVAQGQPGPQGMMGQGSRPGGGVPGGPGGGMINPAQQQSKFFCCTFQFILYIISKYIILLQQQYFDGKMCLLVFILPSFVAVGPMGKVPSGIKTNIKAASQIHPYNR